MATIKEVKRELRYREWAEEIAECQSSVTNRRFVTSPVSNISG